MWIGEYKHNLDEKNRFVLPARFRQQIQQEDIIRFFITRGLEGCIAMYDEVEWYRLTSKLKELSFTKKNARQFNRLFFGSAVEVVPDKQGRIILPDHLREHAGMKDREIIVTGVSDRIEVWSKTQWDSMYESNREDFEKMAEDLFFE